MVDQLNMTMESQITNKVLKELELEAEPGEIILLHAIRMAIRLKLLSLTTSPSVYDLMETLEVMDRLKPERIYELLTEPSGPMEISEAAKTETEPRFRLQAIAEVILGNLIEIMCLSMIEME